MTGVVTNVTDYGIFIEIENGVEGLCHKDMLTWSAKQNSKPGNLYARSQSVDCQILEIDHEKRRLSLGIKQLIPNPWQKFNDENPIGKILDTSITSIKDNILFCNLDETRVLVSTDFVNNSLLSFKNNNHAIVFT